MQSGRVCPPTYRTVRFCPAQLGQLPCTAPAPASPEPAALHESDADLSYPRLPAGRAAWKDFDVTGAMAVSHRLGEGSDDLAAARPSVALGQRLQDRLLVGLEVYERRLGGVASDHSLASHECLQARPLVGVAAHQVGVDAE